MENKRDRMIVCGCYQEALQAVSSEGSRYVFSAEHLALYKSYQKSLFIQPPHVFLPTDDSDRHMRGLCLRYANGRISPEQFIQKLNEIARMMKIGRKKKPGSDISQLIRIFYVNDEMSCPPEVC